MLKNVFREDPVMKTLIATAALTAALLSAGAFANDAPGNAPAKFTNVTVILKNQAWPVKTQMSVELCRIRRCVNA
jgi:hypothetical protein